MGKRLQTKFPDVNHCIIKRTKRDKSNNERVQPHLKRKATTDLEEPLQKISKIQPIFTEIRQDTSLYHEKQPEIANRKIYVNRVNFKDVLNIEETIPCDILYSDELKTSYTNFVSKDFYFHILDEISLEGLDGITIEGFWKRFSIALDGLPNINRKIKNFIWQNVITCSDNFQMFELPVARRELEIYNRFDYMNSEIGVVMELAYELPDCYPIQLVNDASVLGSCATFHDRIDISSEIVNMTIEDAEEKYDRKLVIVANQNLRTYALCGDLVDPLLEFLNTEYSILERIGRSRKLGELTQGRMSLKSAFEMDAKTVFHYKKELHHSGLISKQFFLIKSPVFDQNKTGNLLHLWRFYTNIRSRQSVTAEQIVNLLKMQPDYRIEGTKLRMIFANNGPTVGKLLKNSEFRKLVNGKLYPYRTLYPNATPAEYMYKQKKAEKLLLCYELIDPYVNVAAYWRTSADDESDDEYDEKEEGLSGQMIYNMDSLRNIYYHIHSSGSQGCSALDIKNLTGLDRYIIRVTLRKLVAKGAVNCSKFDEGKQRKFKYTARCIRKTDEQLKLDVETENKPKMSSVKAKILERQKAAIEKKKQENTNRPTPSEISTSVSNFLKVQKPPNPSLIFLIQKFEHMSETKEIFSPICSAGIDLSKKYTINLPSIFFTKHYLSNINEVLNKIGPCLQKYTIRPNFEHFLVKKYKNKCIETTILLFRALLGEISISNELQDSKPTMQSPLPELCKSNQNHDQAKMNYMGNNPPRVYFEKENDITIEIFSSTPPEKICLDQEYPKSNAIVTERVCSRLQKVLDLVNEMKIIEEMNKLLKLIISLEAEEGYDKKIDAKSLCRIVKKLVVEGYIKIYKLSIFNNVIHKTIVFICHPSISHTDDAIQTICQQIKWKYFTSVAIKTSKPHVPAVQNTLEEKIGNSPFSQSDVMNSISEMKKLSKQMMEEINRKFNSKVGRSYGAKPKFTRLRIMHEFLFYVIYNYTGFQHPIPESDIHQLFKSYRIELSDTDLSELPGIYVNEISWKTFVPPLPVHTNWPDGWVLVCDIILRLPVSVLLKIHNCSYEDPELIEILNHPVKRFYLVKDLPDRIRKTVLFKRKYLFSVYDTISRLVFCGLLQFGPQKYKEKDQVFIYMNRRASLLNTITSAPGYNEIEVKEYPVMQFYFETQKDVEYYWQKLHTISMNTRLNAREPGKLVTLTYINSKPEIVQCIKSRTPQEALQYDDGRIPGDGKGACGLDSSMWSHLIRNWFWTSKNGGDDTSLYSGLKNETLKVVSPRTIGFKDLRTNASAKFYLPALLNKKKKDKKVHKKSAQERTRFPCSHSKKYTRTIEKRVSRIKKREYLDEIDRKIVKKLGTKRAHWSALEDELIALCKVADLILGSTQTYKKQIVPYTAVRDVLHRVSPSSKYKTSRSIQRRWSKILKCYYAELEEQISNLFKLKPIHDTFGLLMNKIGQKDENSRRLFRLTETQLISAFVILMSYIIPNKKKVLDALRGNLVNNDHLCEENLKYTEENTIEDRKGTTYSDAKNEVGIKKDVVKSIIHSSLSSKGISGITNQLLRVYQNYSDSLVKESVKELRSSNTITYRTWRDRKAEIWETPFALSQFYIFLQYSTFNNQTAEEAYDTFLDITKNQAQNIEGTEMAVEEKRYGQLLGVNEFFSFHSGIELIFYLPQNTIILNPEIDNYDELVNELAVRYQQKLTCLQESNEAEDFESEQDTFRSKNIEQDIIDEEKIYIEQLKSTQTVIQDTPLDFVIDSTNSETIDRLKTWVTDCMQRESERRSPSPEFMSRSTENIENENNFESNFNSGTDLEDENAEVDGSKKSGRSEKSLGQIPTLDEIKEGMLNTSDNSEDRTIPYITDLSDLLKENVEMKKKYFITEYASLEGLRIEKYEDLQEDFWVQYLDSSMRIKNIWDKIEKNVVVKDFLILPDYKELIRKNGGEDGDIELASEIIEFAEKKERSGATGQEIKDKFLDQEKTCTLSLLIKCLLESGLLLQVGIATLSFVHYKYQCIWLVQQDYIYTDVSTSTTGEELPSTSKSIGIRMMPWVTITGCIDKSTFKNWMSIVLSYCLNYPKVSFGKLCEKYRYLKPVDLFYLLQILEELGCVELTIYDSEENTLYSEWAMPKERPATFLDNIEEIIIQPHNVSMTCIGSFFHKLENAK